MAYRVKVYTFSKTGEKLSEIICGIKTDVFRCEKLYFEKSENNKINEEKFFSCNAHVFIGAMGIAVRKIAPYISDKKKDPAVIVIDEKGEFAIPILSGHVGGANDLAVYIADKINARAVLTTATDVNGYVAIDSIAARNRLDIMPENAAATVNKMLLNGDRIKVYIDDGIEILNSDSDIYELSGLRDSSVSLINKRKYILGIGCRKNTDVCIFEKTVNEILKQNNINSDEIDRIASIDLKKDEKAILMYADKFNIMFETYSADELNSVFGEFDESDFVKEVTGTSNVSERVCVYAGNMFNGGEFILKRQAENGITVSIYGISRRIDLNGKA